MSEEINAGQNNSTEKEGQTRESDKTLSINVKFKKDWADRVEKKIDSVFDWMQKEDRCEKVGMFLDKHLTDCGINLLLFQTLVLCLFCLVCTFRERATFIFGIPAAIICLLVYTYIDKQMFHVLRELIHNTPTSMNSGRILRCFALLFFLGGIYAVIAMGYVGIVVLIFLWTLMIFALAPKLVNIVTDCKCSPGEELISVFTFFVKSIIKMVLYLWPLQVLCAAIGFLAATFSSEMFDEYGFYLGIGYMLSLTIPVLLYIFYLIFFFQVDLVRAIFIIPQKLDELKNNR